MSIAGLTYRHAFGFKSSVHNGVILLDEQNVLYPVGSNIAIYHTETKAQKFIPCQDATALAISPNHRYIAVAERNPRPAISIWDVSTLRKRKTLVPGPASGASGASAGHAASAGSGGSAGAAHRAAPGAGLDEAAAASSGSSPAAAAAAAAKQPDIGTMVFSADSKHFMVTTVGPDASVTIWNWEKAKVSAHLRVCHAPHEQSITSTSFNPADPSQVAVVGHGVLKVYRFQEGHLRPLVNFGRWAETKHFTAHFWAAADKLLLGTQQGHMMLVDTASGEIREDSAHTRTLGGDACAIATMLPYSKGFLVAGAGGLSMYEFLEEAVAVEHVSANGMTTDMTATHFRRVRDWRPAEDGECRLQHMTLSPNEELVVVASDRMQLYAANLNALGEAVGPVSATAAEGFVHSAISEGPLVMNGGVGALDAAAAATADDAIKLTHLSQPFHHGQITGMDVCVRKPLLATCGSDRSVRLWNFVDNTVELVKYFSEDPHSVAIHPSGLYLLVGFSDKLRFMSILLDDLRVFREFSIRGCREVQFSTGGQFFAAVHGNSIQVYSTWNFENLANLKGHNGKVRSLDWSKDDSHLVSAGMDGAVYEWSVADLVLGNIKRENEHVLKTCSYTAAVHQFESGHLFAVGSDKTLKEISEGQVIREIVAKDMVMTQIRFSHSGRMLVVGTAEGSVRSVRYPLVPPATGAGGLPLSAAAAAGSAGTGAAGATPGSAAAAATAAAAASAAAASSMPPMAGGSGSTNVILDDAETMQEHAAHAMAVSRVCISYDDQYLFTASEDGSLFTWKLSDRENRLKSRAKELVYSNEVLMTRADLEEKQNLTLSLKNRVDELKMENECQLRLRDMNFNEKIEEITEKFIQEIEALKITTTVLKADKEREEARHLEQLEDEKETHHRELVEKEVAQNNKLMAEYEKYQDLQRQYTEMQESWSRQMHELEQSREQSIAELHAHFEAMIKQRQAELDQLQNDLSRQQQEFEEIARETEEDADVEILTLHEKYEQKLKAEREIGLRLKGENGIMRKKFNTLQSEIEAHKVELAKMANDEKKLSITIRALEKDIAGLRKEIQERDDTIQDKEKRIYDLKKKNQELEKFKFVLDYKIRELKIQIEPREMDIADMTRQIKDMDMELQHYNRVNANLALNIGDLKLKLKAADHETYSERQLNHRLENLIRKFKVDLTDLVQYIQEPKVLSTRLRGLYHKYCMSDLANASQGRGGSGARLPGGPGGPSTASGPTRGRTPVGTRGTAPAADGAVEDDGANAERLLQKEVATQRQNLEKLVSTLKKRMDKDQAVHRHEHTQIMKENVTLIQEINHLRKELKAAQMREGAAVKQLVDGPETGTSADASAGLKFQPFPAQRLQLPSV